MANLILPDSNVYIDAFRADVDPFTKFASHLDEWEFATCGTIIVEVCRGFREPSKYRHFRARFSVMVCLPATRTTWEKATQLAWTLDRQGVVLPVTDLLIAACALQANATVLTRDAHFQKIPGLRVLERLA